LDTEGETAPTGKTASASRLRIRTRHGQHHLRAPDCGWRSEQRSSALL